MRAPIKPIPEYKILDALLHYDRATGSLTWKVPVGSTKAGQEAGTVSAKGYRIIGIDRRYYTAQRIIWKLVTGDDPAEFVDHIDGDRLNLKWGNLRLATNGQNIQNSKIRIDNSSGVKGVHWDRGRERWAAVITKDGVARRIGRFKTVQEAKLSIVAVRTKLHGEFARHS